MKALITVAGLILLSGCLMKKTVVKALEPVDQVLVAVSGFNCFKFPDGQQAACFQAKAYSEQAHEALKELGVNPSK